MKKQKTHKVLERLKNLQLRIPTAPPTFLLKDKTKYNRQSLKKKLQKDQE